MADYSDILEQAGRQFNVDPKLLALVMGRESGGNPGAVSPKGAAGPMQVMPGTAKEMGVTDLTDPVQNIMAGAKYLSQQMDKYKDVPTALAAYNAGPGAVDKHGGIPPFPETQGYVKAIMSAYQGGAGAAPASAQSMPGLPPVAGSSAAQHPQDSAQPAQLPGLPPTVAAQPQAAGGDPFAALVAKVGGLPAPGKQPAQAQPQADPFAQLVAKANAAPEPAQPPGFFDRALAIPDAVVSGVTGAIGSVAGGATRLLAAKIGDEYGRDNPADVYGGAKAAGDAVQNLLTWQPHTQTGAGLISDLSGVASKAKNALMSSAVGPALSNIGKAYDDTFVNGVVDKNPLMATVNDMLPSVAANVLAGKAGGAALDAASAAPEAVQAAIGKAKAIIGKPGEVPARVDPTLATAASAPPVALPGVGAASANLNPYPPLSAEETARGGSSNFPQVKMSKTSGDVPLPEQITRAQIANEILGPDSEAVRTGVRTGNGNTLVSEYTNAKSPENLPAQIALRDQIAREQSALSDYAQARIDATGASPNLTNNYQRGQVINDAFHGEDGLANYFKQAKQQIYDQAKAQSGNNPIQTGHVEALLSDPQFLAEAERNGHGRVVSGAQKLVDLARNTGFKDPFTGEVHAPGSVAAWDAVRSSNNAGWTPENARTIGAINRAIDQDVAAAAGSEAYKLGDAIHGAEKTIMDTPAIARIFGGADANGIKDGVAMEQLPAKLNDMPLDKWNHIYNTLDDLTRGQVHGAPEGMPAVPTALRQQAQAAKSEMLGALARSVYESGAGKAGVWNQNSANKMLNSVVGQKIINTFPPDEVARFHALNYGGYIMPGVHAYEGAALQSLRMSKPSVVERVAGKAGATAGGAAAAFLNPLATGVGAQGGKWAGDKLAGRSAAKRVEGEANQLTAAMRANSKLGKTGPGNRLSN